MSTNAKAEIIKTLSLLVGMIVIGFIVADMYGIVQKADKRSIQTQAQVNETVDQILQTQENNNIRGNDTNIIFKTLIERINENSNLTFSNQETYFKPLFNKSFEKIFKALNITE